MKKILFTLFIFTLIPLQTWAQEELPSLAPLAMPDWSEEVKAADPTFPKALVEEEDYTSAILEWKRVAYTTSDPFLKERALFEVARLYYTTKQYGNAMKAFERFGKEFPKSERIFEGLYYMALSADAQEFGKGNTFRQRLAMFAPESPWRRGADYAYIWQLGQKGFDEFPNAQTAQERELISRLQQYPARPNDIAWQASGLSIISGAGHLYLGDFQTAVVAFIVNFIFICAFIYSIRFRIWPYVAVFGFAASIIYVGTIFSAHSLAFREAQEARLEAMQQWRDLQPTRPVEDVSEEVSYFKPQEIPLWFYRNVIGKFDGDNGNGYPVTSLYTKQAYEKYGALLGTLMGIDRLLRDWREMTNPIAEIYVDGRERYYDPLIRNTFWLEKES